MYLYLYDAFLSNKQYQRDLARIEIRLMDLGISGKISRLSPLKNLRDLVADEVGNGVRTIVAVGGDGTFISVVNEVIQHGNITLGHIPLGPRTTIAQSLGIPPGEAACDTIAARRLLRLDVGRANNTYFLAGLVVPPSEVTLELDGHYRVKPNDGNYLVSICNLQPVQWQGTVPVSRFNPSDGLLETFIEPAPHQGGLFRRWKTDAQPSILPCRRIKISSSKSVPVLTDGERVLKTPVAVEVVPSKLRMIVGRERKF